MEATAKKTNKETIPWQVAKYEIEEYTITKWTNKWEADPQYEHTKLFYAASNKNKAKYILKMSTYTLITWIKSITGHDNLAYFQSITDLSSWQSVV